MAARMVRCPEGHFYDADKHASCPWCGGPAADAGDAEQKTRKLPSSGAGAGAGAAANPSPAAVAPPPVERAEGATRRLDLTDAGTRPVVGWLVCIDGPDRGRDFRLHAEKNFIGRDGAMDVSLARDQSVSRNKHAIVTYDPKKGNYWLQPGESESLVYLNDELVNTPVLITAYQVIEVGKSKLVLVPFDNEKYPL